MMKNKEYSNGQKTFEQTGDKLTYFFKNGKIKAEGISINGIMEGEWKFYRETGQLWQVGNFKGGQKHGSWLRYNKKGKLAYKESFINGKLVKSK
jgi:antitoxin component YwqK of YwqJK toxin-antitoxin module